MKNKKLRNSVDGLITLYTVVIGVALSLAVAMSIEAKEGLNSISSVSILLFVSFVATLFPFFHGAIRHLDEVYIENPSPSINTGALIIDFALLFLHALAFVVLSQLLQRPSHFAWFLLAVLAIDVVWGIFTHFTASPQEKLSAESKWTLVNLFFILLVALYLIHCDIYLDHIGDELKISLLLSIFCVLRSTVDYIWCRDLYFPKCEQ